MLSGEPQEMTFELQVIEKETGQVIAYIDFVDNVTELMNSAYRSFDHEKYTFLVNGEKK